MRKYEMMVIIDPEVDERTVEPSMSALFGQVEDLGGKVEKLDVWGKRKLAYPILKKTDGIYVVVDMETTPEIAKELDRQLGLNESILRTKLMRKDA
ncbi:MULTISPECIES: 30S ribosomal protein S6 [Mobiluncus]|uniref:30S ribosomal protein S6 n=1 Tax=Mobiluncus sp. TaxID=47293 RepID=UPI0024AE07C9|nr:MULTISPECIES: 30S ribosomal protein S6 [unclassified Mobiluncus]MDY6077062.1 30S ribosomal protein S6 [Mobiluncus sp.]